MENRAPKKLRIALIAPSMRVIGGQSVQAERLVDAFAGDDSVEISLVPIDPNAVFRGIRYLRTIFTSLRYWWLLVAASADADVFLVSSAAMTGYIIATLPALAVAKLFRKKVILNYHSGEFEKHVRVWKRTALPTMRKFDEIVVPSRFLAEAFAKHGLEAKVIPNFIDSSCFPFRERGPLRPVFLSNRNFDSHYKVGDILRAFQIIGREIPDARLLVAGFGREEASLKRMASDLGLKGVEFLGRIGHCDMGRIYDSADIYLNSSVVDNMPISFIEAFSCGLPVVSYATGGIPYMVTDGVSGMLVETNDYKALAEKALSLLRNPDEARRLASNAREECTKYSTETVRAEWKEHLNSLLV